MFKVFEEEMEVNGAAIKSITDALSSISILTTKMFERAGLPAPEKIESGDKAWYSQQNWLNAFKLIADKIGNKTMYSIGLKIPENAILPPDINNIEKALSSIDVAYHMNHRNKNKDVLFDPSRPKEMMMLEGIGHYGYQKIPDENKAILVCENPYHCDFDRGIIAAMAKRFNSSSSVMHDDSKPCRKEGAKTCTYIATWP